MFHLAVFFFVMAALFLFLFCFIGLFEPDLSERRGEKSPGEACLKVRSCNLYWKTVYLSLVHTEF